MRYKDDLQQGFVNGRYVGQSRGSRLPDGLAPESDGLDAARSAKHVGTVTPDGAQPGYPVPDVSDPEE